MKTKLTVVIKESKREVQQIDELIIPTTAYKLLGPIHDLIMRLDVGEDSKKPQWAKDFIKWYKNNNYTQMVGEAIHEWEKSMNDLWASGRTGQAAVIAINALDVSTIGTTSIGKLFQKMRERWIAEEEEEKQKIADQIAAELEKAEYEKSAQRTVEKQSEIIRKQQREIAKHQEERARRLLAQAEQAREALAQIAQSHGHSASQEKMYTSSLNEDKKMTKKYSSFKQQQTITENFRKFISEEGDDPEGGEPQDWDVSDQGVYLKGKWVPLEDGFGVSMSTHSTAFTNSPGKVAKRFMDAAEIYDPDDRDDLLDFFTSDVFEEIEAAREAGKPRLKYGEQRHSRVNNLTTGGRTESKVRFTNKKNILAAIKESYPDGISRYADVIVDFTGLNDEAIWQELDKVGLVAHLSREIPDVTDPRIIQSEVEVWLDNRHYDAL
jgi:hypothetical protein